MGWLIGKSDDGTRFEAGNGYVTYFADTIARLQEMIDEYEEEVSYWEEQEKDQ